MVRQWNNFDGARMWVSGEFGKMTRGKSMTQAKRTKILKMLWKRAEMKDKRGEF